MKLTYAEILTELRRLRDERKPLESRVTEIQKRENKLLEAAAAYPEAKQQVLANATGYSGAIITRRTGGLKAARAAAAAARRAGVIGSDEATADSSRTATPAATPRKRMTAMERAAAEAWTRPATPRVHAPTLEESDDAPKLTDAAVGVLDLASRRKWSKAEPRRTAIARADGTVCFHGQTRTLDVGDGSVAAWLRVLPENCQRVYFVGPRPWETWATATKKGDAMEWFAATPEGWKIDGRGHYTERPETPTGRWRQEGTGRRIEFKHMREWTGSDVDVEPSVVWKALVQYVQGITRNFNPRGTEMLALMGSPSQMGADLWRRSIPNNAEYPVMSDELRELIRATSGQGRNELFTPPVVPAKLPALYHYDATFAYSSLVWGLPVGAPTRITAQAWERMDAVTQDRTVKGRGWWDVTVTVPHDWDHVGILGLPHSWTPGDTERQWEYPSQPGRTFRTWCSGDELVIARRMGWHITVNDGVTWAEGKPLTKWRDALIELWGQYGAMAQTTPQEDYRQAAELTRKMLRQTVLNTIGTFHGGGPKRSGIVDADSATSLPASARVQPTEDGTGLAWSSGAVAGAASDTSHPEWSALIYGRMRARLLLFPKAGTGVLTGYAEGRPLVRRDEVVSFRTDAVYVTRDLGWTNPHGEPGLFRLKGAHPTPVAAPLNLGDLMALKDGAE